MKRHTTLLTLMLAVGVLTAGTAQAANSRTIQIGYFNWTDNIFNTNVIKYILEEKMDRKVKLTKADPAVIYAGVASGDLDFHVDAWLPETHADYMKKVEGDVVDVGSIYTGARLGWVVPDYIPKDELNSITDLKSEEVMEKLDGKIIGIDPGAGLTRLSKKAMDEYGLSNFGYQLIVSSGSGMTAALKRAIDKHEWVVVTGWSPHWKFGRWNLRYIDDPKNVLGSMERADILVRKGFYRDEPAVFELLDRMTIPIDQVQSGMNDAEERSYPKAAKKWVEDHSKLVNFWTTGEL